MQFFLKATMLDQMKFDYIEADTNKNEATNSLEQKKMVGLIK